jgi:hypothetical protein
MKKNNLIVALILSFSSFQAFSQSYEEIYAVASQEVQSRIDQNKIQGINILIGIVSNHTIGFTGVGFSQKENLQEKLNEQENVFSFQLSDDNTSITIQSSPLFTNESFEELLNNFQATITGYSVNYTVNEQ